jgi:hypothetical protein
MELALAIKSRQGRGQIHLVVAANMQLCHEEVV